MPFFKFRRGDAASSPPAGSAVQAQSVEVMRKRARHRLMGASVLVLLGVVIFPLLFDTQPRPVAVDIPIVIPGKNSVKPLTVPAPVVATAPAVEAAPALAPAEKVAAAASLSSKEEIFTSKPATALSPPASNAIKKEAQPELKREARADAVAEGKPPAKPPVKADARPGPTPAVTDGEAARAVALLNGAGELAKPATAEPKTAAPETKARMVVQVGAFAESAKADETRQKLEKAGLKTYTQVAETKDGKRIRVRVGPFASRAEAEKAVNKIRSLDLPVAILSL